MFVILSAAKNPQARPRRRHSTAWILRSAQDDNPSRKPGSQERDDGSMRRIGSARPGPLPMFVILSAAKNPQAPPRRRHSTAWILPSAQDDKPCAADDS